MENPIETIFFSVENPYKKIPVAKVFTKMIPGVENPIGKKFFQSKILIKKNSCSQKNSQKLISGAKNFQEKIPERENSTGKKNYRAKNKIFWSNISRKKIPGFQNTSRKKSWKVGRKILQLKILTEKFLQPKFSQKNSCSGKSYRDNFFSVENPYKKIPVAKNIHKKKTRKMLWAENQYE